MTRLIFRTLIALMTLWSLGPRRADAVEKPPEEARPERRLNLQEMWRLARQRFPGLKAARHNVEAARYTLNEQRALYLPSGDFTAFLSWAPTIKCQSASELNLTSGGQPVLAGMQPVGGPSQCLSTSVNLNLLQDGISPYFNNVGPLLRINANVYQPLYASGKIEAANALGKVGLDLARAGQDASSADLALNVLRAYYGLKAARAALISVQDGRTQIVSWVKRIDQELEAGKGTYTELDLMRLKFADAQVEMAVVDLERTIRSTLSAARYLLQDDKADVDETDLVVANNETRELGYYLDMALVRRIELRQLKAYGAGAQAMRQLRIGELLPDFAAVVNFSYGLAPTVEDPNNAFMNRMNYLGAGIGLAMRLNLDFGPRAARLQKALADIRQYEAKRTEALGGVALEVERTYNDLREAQRRLKAAELAERRARGWVQGMKQAIDLGNAQSHEIIDALRAYFDMHTTVIRTINDVNVLSATLRRQSGLDVIPD